MDGRARLPADWRHAVEVREEPGLAGELGERGRASTGVRSVAVTDLLATRPAYWRMVAPPVAPDAARRARMESGRHLHRRLGEVLGRDGQLEVRVRRDGIVGRIDALTDRPIEVKTSSRAVSAERLVTDRPEYVEQLAMYCTLAGRTTGRILAIEVRDEEVRAVRAADLALAGLDSPRLEMERRARALRSSWESRRTDGLARCPWFDRGCEFRAGPTCDCTGREPEESTALLDAVTSAAPAESEEARVFESLRGPVRIGPPATVDRFRELVYPRRTYFERVRPPPTAEAWSSPLDRPPDAYARLTGAIESGPVGEVARRTPLSDEPEEEVAAFRGEPFLARTSVARTPPTAADLVHRSPQYVLELGFRCAATGARAGRVIVAYERADRAADRLKVFRVAITSATVFARLWRARRAALIAALASGEFAALEPCPGWMFETCPYRSECGCGGPASGRSQR